MEILVGKVYKSKIAVGIVPIGTEFKLRKYGPGTNAKYLPVFDYGIVTVEQVEGKTLGYFNEFNTEAEMQKDFEEMFEDV